MSKGIVDNWRRNTATKMWQIYISFAVLFRVVIKRFGEQVKTLEVKWHSTIHLICDASCVGPRPQLGLTWFYRDKNQSKPINIEKLFRSPKFETYPTNLHRKNELVIRDFGPNEETDFTCRGSIKTQRLEAKVALIGTDCLLKYNFRCKLGNKCINRAYLCNHHNECPNGEDEVGCGSVQTDGILTIPDIQPSYAGNYVDTGTTDTGRTGSAVTRPDVEVKPAIEEGQLAEVKIAGPGALSIVDGGSVELTCTASAILKSLIRWRRREGPLPPGHSLRGGILSIPRLTVEYGGEYICSTSSPEGSYQASVFIIVTEDQRPVLNVSPVRVEEPVGSTVIFRCSVTGQGPFNVVWSRLDSRPLPSDRASQSPRYELTLRELKREDNGRYVCTATNANGVTRGYVDLTVVSGPNPIRVQVDRTRIEVEEGQTARIVCTAVGSLREAATYIMSWSKQGAAMPSRAIDHNGVLIIPNIQVSDAGNFVCTGSDMFSTGSVTATIIVTISESAPSIRIEPRYQTVEEGSPVRFECIVTATPRAKVEWHRGDRPLSPEASVTQDLVFQLPRAHSSDEGDYFRKATNNVGTSDMRTILYVTKKETKPDITIIVRQTSVVALIGSTARLECYVEDETGRVTLFWSRTGGLPPGSVQTDGILTIPDIQPSYASNYVCTGTTDTGRTGSAVTRLDVEVKPATERPTVRVEPEKITVPMGTTGTLRCIVTGVPAPTVTWLKSRQELSTNHQVGREIDGDILRITQATMEDRGIYVCSAENIAGSDQDWGIVEVERRMRPKIDLYPEGTQTVSVGGSALFQCRVINGDPPPKVTWSRVGGLQLTERTEVKENGVIMFKGTTQQEQGSYICIATNDMGTTTATATLIVQVEEGQRAKVKIAGPGTLLVVDGGSVELTCTASAILNPLIRWRRREGPLPPGHSLRGGILSIPRLTVEYGGEYICSTSSPEGSYQASVFIIVTVSPRLIVSPSRLVARAGENIILRCSLTGSRPFNIEWSKVNGVLSPRALKNEGVLEIQQVTAADAGRYRCVATSASDSSEGYAVVEITVPPTIVIQPSKTINAIVGQRVRMECIAQGEPIPTVYWINPLVPRLGNIVPKSGFPQTKGTAILDIPNVGKENKGYYTCAAQNAGGRTEDRVQLIVQESQRSEVKISGPGTLSVVDGWSVELTCTASAILNPLIRWRRREGPLPPGHSLRGGILSIPRLTVEYGGEYICSTFSPEGSYQASVFIIVKVVTEAPPAVCTADQYKCANGECVDGRYLCDGQYDCYDESDEENCPKCRGDQFQCADGNCVEARMKCNGTPQCGDGSDERNCPRCPPNNFMCETTSQLECVDVSLVCDRFPDCTDGSDEVGCSSCRIDQFTCTDGNCVEGNMRCDGRAQCEDRSDEIGCHGAWSEWTNISHCYARSCNMSCKIVKGPCDKGQMKQIRFCNNPSPGYGGKWCHGQVLRIVECENYVEPGWSEWGPVTCDKDCRSSENDTVSGYRRRTCNNPPPIHEMDDCCGYDIIDTEEDSNICNDLPLCIYTTASTTATSSTTKVTCPTKEGFDYGYTEPTENAIKKDDDAAYDYSGCS